jgi:formyl-CoA transferase/CoA:oxalate CoA-transferase
MNGPLEGIRVLDFSKAGAGPYSTMFLGDLGADIIKIEAGEGDITRGSPGPNLNGENYHYLGLNRNKRGLYLDLRTESGKEAFYNLVKLSDVVFDNFRPETTKRLGIDYETLSAINPRIITLSLTGYGESGPYRDRSSWDSIVSALSGITSLIGERDGPPTWTNVPFVDFPFVDFATGLTAAIGVLAAIIKREKTGLGQKVGVALLDMAIALVPHFITRYFLSGENPERLGSGHHSSVPFGVFATKEGYISLGPCWPRICRALGAEWLMDDPRFVDLAGRVKHRDELNKIIADLFLREKAEDWLEILYAKDIPAAHVNTVAEAVADPQVLHNNMVINVQHSMGGEIKMAGIPIKMPGCDREEHLPPPTLGQHTEEILTNLLGYSEEKFRRFKEEYEKHAD